MHTKDAPTTMSDLVTMSVRQAGKHFYDFGPSASYRAVSDLIAIRMGKKTIRVLVGATARMLEERAVSQSRQASATG